MFSNSDRMSLPVLVTDDKNKVVYKNAVATRIFTDIRSSSVMSSRFVYKEDVEAVDTLCGNGMPSMVTMKLIEYTCCCLIYPKVIDEKQYRFYTVIPFIFEFFDNIVDSEKAREFLIDYEENIEKQIDYMLKGLEGNQEIISPAARRRINAMSKRVTAFVDRVREALGVSAETLSSNFGYKRGMNIYKNIFSIVSCLNSIDTSGYGQIIFNDKDLGYFANVNTIVFGRLFSYISFISLKYGSFAPIVSLKYEEDKVRIVFRTSNMSEIAPELFELDLGYIRTYASKNEMEIDCSFGGSKYAEISIVLNDIHKKSPGFAVRASSPEVFENWEDIIRISFDEASRIL